MTVDSLQHSSTATASPTSGRSIWSQTAALSIRSMIALWRQPATVVPSMIFPLFFVALGTSSFSRAINLPGFPVVDSFLNFALAGAIVQGVLFGSITGAAALATDIESGFFDRLLVAPTARSSILFGRLAGAMAFGAFQTAVFIAILLPFGLNIKSGPIGVLVMILGGTMTALGVGAIMSAMALRTGSSEAVQGSFPLLFIMLFFSSAFFPRQTMSGIYGTLANLNPVSYLIEGFRDLTIDGLTTWAVVRALGFSALLAAFGMGLSLRSLRIRLGRQ